MEDELTCHELSPRDTLVKRLIAAHEAWFDLEVPGTLAGRTFAAIAHYHEHGENYVLTKRAKMWEVDTHEHLFIESRPTLDEAALNELVEFMKTKAISLVDARPNHMSTSLSLIIVADSAAEGLKRNVRNMHFSKSFKLGIWGWCDLRLAVVDLNSQNEPRIYANGAGKPLLKTIRANLNVPSKR